MSSIALQLLIMETTVVGFQMITLLWLLTKVFWGAAWHLIQDVVAESVHGSCRHQKDNISIYLFMTLDFVSSNQKCILANIFTTCIIEFSETWFTRFVGLIISIHAVVCGEKMNIDFLFYGPDRLAIEGMWSIFICTGTFMCTYAMKC